MIVVIFSYRCDCSTVYVFVQIDLPPYDAPGNVASARNCVYLCKKGNRICIMLSSGGKGLINDG